MIRPATLARLAAGLAGLAAAEVVLLRPGGDEPPAPSPRLAAPAAPLAPARTAPDVAGLVADVLARPVFSVSRRPAEAPAASQAPAGPAGLPRLTGILVGGGVKTAIFAGERDGKPVAVSERGKVGSYVVQSIEADRATVSGPGGSQVLRPSFDPNAPSPAAPAAPQPGFFPQAAVPQQAPQPGQSSILDALRRGAAPRVSVPGLAPLPQAPEQ